MLSDRWLSIYLLSFLIVALANAILASCTSLFYARKSSGHLSHSQLRIKQGNANFEHRLNVFAQTFAFSLATLRVYLVSLALWGVINGWLYLSRTL